MTVIDATNMVVGRLASDVAKRLLKKERIDIINAENAIFTGNKIEIVEKLRQRTSITPKGNPHNGPKYSRMPDKIVKRAVRGMLPWKKPTGKEVYKNLKVHIGTPEQFAEIKATTVESAKNRVDKKYITVGEISKSLGAKW